MDAISRIKDAVRIPDLVQLVLTSKSGRARQGQCPFCRKGVKSACFSYYEDTNSFLCYSCGLSGSVIDFFMALTGRDGDPAAAIRELADRAGIVLEPITPEQAHRLTADKRREAALGYAATYYASHLASKATIMTYLADRGFNAAAVKEHRLGWADSQLLAKLKGAKVELDAMGLTIEDFIAAGLIAEGKEDRKGQHWDFFRGRIIFPITKRGAVVHMSGRALPPSLGGKVDEPKKYKNLPMPITTLFLEDCIGNGVTVFEGLPDALSAHVQGVKTCGQQGTQGMPRHAAKFKGCRLVYVCFDTDGPGKEAAFKAGSAIWLAVAENGGEVRLVRLPDGVKDTNEFFMGGAALQDFEDLQREARPLPEVMLQAVTGDMPASDQSKLLKAILRLIVPLDAIQQEAFLRRIKEHLRIPLPAIRDLLRDVTGEASNEVAPGQDLDMGDGVVIDFRSVREICPAQDFVMRPTPRGNYCTYLNVARRVDENGRKVVQRSWEPVIISTVHGEDGIKVVSEFANDLPLTKAELKRIPFESAVRGRWRTEAQHAYGVELFMKNQVGKVDAWQLFQDIATILRRYVWLPSDTDYEIIATWIMMTYVFQLFNVIGYMHLHGVRESAKSNLMTLIEEMAFNAKATAGQTQSVLFRSVEANCRTVLQDEAEKLNNPEPGTPEHSMSLIANAGYKKGRTYELSEPNPKLKGGWEPGAFNIYAPKVFASISSLNYTLGSRCIIISCLRATQDELDAANIADMAQSYHRDEELVASIRDRLHVWGLTAFPRLHTYYTETLVEMPSLRHLRGREREMWIPLLVIAAYLDEERCGGNFDELGGPENSLAISLVAAQRHKEGARRLLEADQAIEVVVLAMIHEMITTGAIVPVGAALAPQGAKAPVFITKDLAALISDPLREMGFLRDRGDKPGAISMRRVVDLLSKTNAIDPADRYTVRVSGDRKPCVALDVGRIKLVVERLGGTVSEDA